MSYPVSWKCGDNVSGLLERDGLIRLLVSAFGDCGHSLSEAVAGRAADLVADGWLTPAQLIEACRVAEQVAPDDAAQVFAAMIATVGLAAAEGVKLGGVRTVPPETCATCYRLGRRHLAAYLRECELRSHV